MSKKEIEMWDVELKFRVRKDETEKKRVKEEAETMVANASMGIEDFEVKIK